MGGQAKTEVGPGLRAGNKTSNLRMPEGGQAMLRLLAEMCLGLRRRPDTIPGEGDLDNSPDVPNMSWRRASHWLRR